MTRAASFLLTILMITFAMNATAHSAAEQSELAKQSTWTPPATDEVRKQAIAWLAEQKNLDSTAHEQAEALWNDVSADAPSEQLFDRLAATIALADSRAAQLVTACSSHKSPDASWLLEKDVPTLVSANMRLLLGRCLAQGGLYDESLAQLKGLAPKDVVDPASLLFYQGVVNHQLLNKDDALEALDTLLERDQTIPRRYQSLARLMQADLEPLEDDTLDHIARRMEDIRRRLDLGRAGAKEKELEDGVVESLDKMIKKMEDEQQAAQDAMQNAKQQNPSGPAQQSMPLGGKGKGDVAKKDIGHKSGWGDLPPKDRHEALQQIGQDFPAHYRDMIEQYFRKLAREPEEKQP